MTLMKRDRTAGYCYLMCPCCRFKVQLSYSTQLVNNQRRMLQKIKESFESNKTAWLASGAICVLLAGVVVYRNRDSSKTTASATSGRVERQTFSEVYGQVIKKASACLQLHKTINEEVIRCILKGQYELAENDYVALMQKVRSERRRQMKNKESYSQLIVMLEKQLEDDMDRSLNAILAHLKVDKTYWIEAVEEWSAQSEASRESWEELLVELDQRQMDALRDPSKAPLPLRKLKEVTDYKIRTLRSLGEEESDLSSSASQFDHDPNAKYDLIDMYLRDLAFEKFGCEEEDILYSVSLLSEEEKEKFYHLEDEFTDLMRHEILGDQSIEEDFDEDENMVVPGTHSPIKHKAPEDDSGSWEDVEEGEDALQVQSDEEQYY